MLAVYDAPRSHAKALDPNVWLVAPTDAEDSTACANRGQCNDMPSKICGSPTPNGALLKIHTARCMQHIASVIVLAGRSKLRAVPSLRYVKGHSDARDARRRAPFADNVDELVAGSVVRV